MEITKVWKKIKFPSGIFRAYYQLQKKFAQWAGLPVSTCYLGRIQFFWCFYNPLIKKWVQSLGKVYCVSEFSMIQLKNMTTWIIWPSKYDKGIHMLLFTLKENNFQFSVKQNTFLNLDIVMPTRYCLSILI